jgi:hypothetical protein
MKKYALVNDSIVTQIIEIDENDYQQYSGTNHMVVDVTDLDPQPQANWILNGNKLEFPNGTSNREKLEIDLAEKKTDFGIKLARTAIDRIGARNKILNKNGTQVATLLTQLLSVKLLLETGALGTARYSSLQLKAVYTEYSDIFDYVVNEINTFESTFGL